MLPKSDPNKNRVASSDESPNFSKEICAILKKSITSSNGVNNKIMMSDKGNMCSSFLAYSLLAY